MVYKAKSGRQFHNPAIGREHDRNEAASKSKSAGAEDQGSSDQKDGAEAHKVEIHHPEGKDNPSPGNHHTVTTRADGSQDEMDHASAEEAHAHAGQEMGVGGDEHQLGDAEEEDGSMGAEVCPECGSEMEGGTCPKCGYSADKGAIAGQHEEEDPGDHEYR